MHSGAPLAQAHDGFDRPVVEGLNANAVGADVQFARHQGRGADIQGELNASCVKQNAVNTWQQAITG